MLKPVKELTEEEIWALQINYYEAQQWHEEIAQNLRDLMLHVGWYYSPPEHDPKCDFCTTYRALNALKRYFENDPTEVMATLARAGYDLDKLKPRRRSMIPTLGRIIVYRSRTGDYDCAAIISATRPTLNMKNVEAGYIPNITDETNVHLTVFSAGKPGMRKDAVDFLVESPHGRSENISGTYQEWNIAYDPDGGPGTWRWPDRI